MAGHGSTIDVLGTGMWSLLNNPGQWQRLQNEPGLIHTAVQEMFRFESPLPFFHRYAAKEINILGKTYPKGSKFGLLYGSANRDERQFSEPGEFDIERNPNKHLAFGRGAHLCLGNHLSRLDMEIIFLTLSRLTASIELLGEKPAFKKSLSVRGLQSLPIRLHAR